MPGQQIFARITKQHYGSWCSHLCYQSNRCPLPYRAAGAVRLRLSFVSCLASTVGLSQPAISIAPPVFIHYMRPTASSIGHPELAFYSGCGVLGVASARCLNRSMTEPLPVQLFAAIRENER